jgi:predicted secreted protein
MACQEITKDCEGRTITIHVGDVVGINLIDNETGFRWRIDHFDANVLRQLGVQYLRAGAAPGSGGTRRFEFQGTSAGLSEVTLKLARAWEKGQVDQFRVAVLVVP